MYKRAVEFVRGLETTIKNVKLLKHIKRETHLQEGSQVHHVAPSMGGSALVCYWCGMLYSASIARILYAMAVGRQSLQVHQHSYLRCPVHHIEEGANEEEVQEDTCFVSSQV